MPHWKSMMDEKDFLFAFDLQGKEAVVTIDRVIAGEISGEQGRKTKKPIATFVGKKKKLALNATNCKTIAALYGNDTAAWSGKSITLYPTTTTFGGTTVECIRVRPSVPRQAGSGKRGTPEPDRAEADEASEADEAQP